MIEYLFSLCVTAPENITQKSTRLPPQN